MPSESPKEIGFLNTPSNEGIHRLAKSLDLQK